jgi:hypothetical protein
VADRVVRINPGVFARQRWWCQQRCHVGFVRNAERCVRGEAVYRPLERAGEDPLDQDGDQQHQAQMPARFQHPRA